MAADQKGTAATLYQKLSTDRDPFLRRARACAKLTIPSLMPPEGHTGTTDLPTPWQAHGARGVNNLSAKLLTTLLPANAPCFRLAIDDFALEALTKQEGMRAKVEEGLNKIERSVQTEVEASAVRVDAFEGLKQLVVCGNVLLFLPQEGGVRVFRLDRYVVRRDHMGTVLDIVTEEEVDPSVLQEELEFLAESTSPQADVQSTKADKCVKLYTHVKRDGKRWKVYQEVKGQVIPGSEGFYPIDKPAWIPVRFTKVDGEDYGRSYVEEYLGDLQSLEGLMQAIVEGSAAAAKVLFLVNPNGVTDKDVLAKAENGEFQDGMESDISVLQLQKYNDFRIAKDTIDSLTERLSFAFLLNSAVQRSGERVTAEEIRYMANELESALGGIYSVLSQEFQLPLIKRLMYRMERQKRLPSLPTKAVKPVIVTGIEALGRGNDLDRLTQFAGLAVQAAQLPPELDKSDFLTRAGTALQIDMKGLVKSADQLAAEQQQAMQMQMMQQGLNPAITQGGQLLKQGMANAAQANQQGQ